MKQNVLQVCHGYSPPFDDVARQWARLFDDEKYSLTTVFLTGEKSEQVAADVGGKVLFWEYTSRDLKGLKRGLIKRLRILHQEESFDFCVAHRYKAIFLALSIKCLKVIGVNHAYGVYDRWLRRVCILSKKKQLLLVGVSDAVRDNIRQSLPTFPTEKIQTVYNRLDVEAVRNNQVDREMARSFLGFSSEHYLFGAVGRLHPDKDYETLISGFARVVNKMANAHLAIVGRGDLEPDLIAQAEALGVRDRVHFLGFVKDAYRYFKGFDSFVLSSDHEPFGMVLLEAMLAEIPVVYTDCGGAPEVVGPIGLSFRVGDSEDLSTALLSVYRNQNDFNKEQLVERVQKYFSDSAVTKSFWNMPSIESFLGDKYTDNSA